MPKSFFPRADARTRARLDQDEAMRLANSFEWSSTELGPIADWPEPTRAAARLIMSSAAPMALLIGPRGIMLYNSAYVPIAGGRHPGILGKSVLEGWPEVAEFNTDVLRRVLAGESLEYSNQKFTFFRNGTAEDVWLNLDYSPVLDDDGTGLAVLAIVQETTNEVQAAAQLADSEQRFRTLADTMPQMVWSTLPDGYHDYYNARWYEFTGVPEGSTDGEAWNGMFHPDDQDRAWQVWRLSLASGEPYHIEYRLRHRSGEYRWVLGRALPIRDAKGNIVRWFGTCTDIHDTKMVAEEREVVAQELSHRIKNIFAVITGLISLAGRSKPEIRQAGEELRERIHALGRAHDFVRPHSKASEPRRPPTLHALIRELLAPYETDAGGKIVIAGEDVSIDDGAATPLALLFHELATNSAKYGALLRPGGEVTVSARQRGDRVVMTWDERGAEVAEGEHAEGFGSRLIALSVEAQMRGSIKRTWRNDGLTVEVDVPFSALNQSAALQAHPAS